MSSILVGGCPGFLTELDKVCPGFLKLCNGKHSWCQWMRPYQDLGKFVKLINEITSLRAPRRMPL